MVNDALFDTLQRLSRFFQCNGFDSEEVQDSKNDAKQSQENQQEVDSLANLNPERQHVFYDRNPEFTTTHKDQYCNNLTPT